MSAELVAEGHSNLSVHHTPVDGCPVCAGIDADDARRGQFIDNAERFLGMESARAAHPAGRGNECYFCLGDHAAIDCPGIEFVSDVDLRAWRTHERVAQIAAQSRAEMARQRGDQMCGTSRVDDDQRDHLRPASEGEHLPIPGRPVDDNFGADFGPRFVLGDSSGLLGLATLFAAGLRTVARRLWSLWTEVTP